jgi:hypothetical protein
MQASRLELDKAARSRCPAAEPDDGDGAEGLLTAADIKIDVVSENVDEPGTFPGLVIRQRSHETPDVTVFRVFPQVPNLAADARIAFTSRNDAKSVPRLLTAVDQF